MPMRSAAVILGAALSPFLIESLAVAGRDPLFRLTRWDALVLAAAATIVAAAARALHRDSGRAAALACGCSVGFVVGSQVLMLGRVTWITLAGSLLSAVVAGVVTQRAIERLLLRPALHLLPAGIAVAAGAVLVWSWRPNPATQPRGDHRPDVLLVVLDTTRADHLSLYGYHRPTTPALARLGRTARVYDSAWSPAPWTPPAHASILTGLLPAEHGCDRGLLATPAPTLAEVLRDAGYRTFAAVNNPQLNTAARWSRGFDEFRETWRRPRTSLQFWRWRPGDKWRGDAPRTLALLERWWATHAGDRRFAMLNLLDPHAPYGDRDDDVFLDDQTRAAPDLSISSEDYDAGVAKADGVPLARLQARYDADILAMDRALGRFFDWLEARGELDRTLVVVTADHGERLGERGLVGHQVGLDDVLLRVPLVVRLPGAVPPGRVERRVQTHGIFRTIAERTGVPIPDALPRAPALDRQDVAVVVAQTRHQEWYADLIRQRRPDKDLSPFLGDWSSASDGAFKLTRSSHGTSHLVDLTADPWESRDAAAEWPEVAARLSDVLDRLPEFPPRGEAATVPSDVAELLRQLGYAGGGTNDATTEGR